MTSFSQHTDSDGLIVVVVAVSGAVIGSLFDAALAGAFLGAVAGFVVADQDPGRDENDSLEAAHAAYVHDNISEAELERRIELAIDPRAEEIRDVLEAKDGIGPGISSGVALEYESIEELRETDRDRLENVYDVGEARADLILEAVDE